MPCSRPSRALDPRSRKVRRTWVTVAGVVLALLGLLWFLQGIGVVGGSFMSGEPVWAVIGLVLLLFAGRLLVEALRGNRS
jgi:hypothetical protein